MRFDEFRYLWPPRPTNAVPSTMLSHYQKKGWYAQYKKNGSLAIIYIDPDGAIEVYNRHQDEMSWNPPDEVCDQLRLKLSVQGSWWVYVGELLHSKASEIKDTLYLFDVLVMDGELLEGLTYHDRLKRLSLNVVGDSSYSHLLISENVWLARSFAGDVFQDLYDGIESDDSIDEGLVLKDPNAVLAPCTHQSANRGWQVKVRYGRKSFAF
ncbi:MAG TPA: hypothetical protein ENI27_01665 [bacterium]|nr:hypothetical protein [bacterium]